MARLSIISLDGAETWTPYLNGDGDEMGIEKNKSLSFSEWERQVSASENREAQWESFWTVTPSKIDFMGRLIWEGRFTLREDTFDGTVTAIERRFTGGYGHIRIDQVSIPVKGEYGMFWGLNVPTEIAEPLGMVCRSLSCPVPEALLALRVGDEYLFTTAYDSNSLSTQSPQEPQESYSQSLSGVTGKADVLVFSEAPSYGAGQADVITNFRPEEGDTLSIETGLFAGASGTPRLKIAKNTKVVKKLSRSTTDFIYDKSSGYLYFNENGKGNGFGDGGVFAIIDGKISIWPANVSFI
jgi:hypothetical protein